MILRLKKEIEEKYELLVNETEKDASNKLRQRVKELENELHKLGAHVEKKGEKIIVHYPYH